MEKLESLTKKELLNVCQKLGVNVNNKNITKQKLRLAIYTE